MQKREIVGFLVLILFFVIFITQVEFSVKIGKEKCNFSESITFIGESSCKCKDENNPFNCERDLYSIAPKIRFLEQGKTSEKET